MLTRTQVESLRRILLKRISKCEKESRKAQREENYIKAICLIGHAKGLLEAMSLIDQESSVGEAYTESVKALRGA